MSRATPPLPHVPLWSAQGQPRPVVSMYIFEDIISYRIFGTSSISISLMLMIIQISAQDSAHTHTHGDTNLLYFKTVVLCMGRNSQYSLRSL